MIKSNLPRPLTINQKYYKAVVEESNLPEAERLILEEMQLMLINDNFKHPVKGMKEIKRLPANYLEIQPAYLDYARSLIS